MSLRDVFGNISTLCLKMFWYIYKIVLINTFAYIKMKNSFKLQSFAFLKHMVYQWRPLGMPSLIECCFIIIPFSCCGSLWRSLLSLRFHWQGTICPQGENLDKRLQISSLRSCNYYFIRLKEMYAALRRLLITSLIVFRSTSSSCTAHTC